MKILLKDQLIQRKRTTTNFRVQIPIVREASERKREVAEKERKKTLHPRSYASQESEGAGGQLQLKMFL